MGHQDGDDAFSLIARADEGFQCDRKREILTGCLLHDDLKEEYIVLIVPRREPEHMENVEETALFILASCEAFWDGDAFLPHGSCQRDRKGDAEFGEQVPIHIDKCPVFERLLACVGGDDGRVGERVFVIMVDDTGGCRCLDSSGVRVRRDDSVTRLLFRLCGRGVPPSMAQGLLIGGTPVTPFFAAEHLLDRASAHMTTST